MGGRGAVVLVLTQARRAAFFRGQMPEATVVTDPASLAGQEARFDAALVDGLEDEPWDRWALQRVHRLLRADAPIVVVVPRLLSLASALDLRFLAYAARQVILRFVRRWRPTFELPGPVHRRYYLPRLARKMESVGYTAVGPGEAPAGATFAQGLPWLAQRSTLTARKAPSLRGFDGREWPDPAQHRRRHAEGFAALYAAREAWLSRHPQFRRLAPRALDLAGAREFRVLVLAPHPDDELIGCGGTLCRLAAAGADISIVQATDGARLDSLRDLPEARRRTVRLEEAKRVASALRARVLLWRLPDAQLRPSSQTIARLARLLGKLAPTHVFTPFLGDGHADHVVLSRVLGAALGSARVEAEILQYEVWSLVPANRYVDVTEQAQALERLMLLYERAMRVEDFVHFCESRNLARALEITRQPGYVEAFLSTSAGDYRQLVEGGGESGAPDSARWRIT